MECSEIHDLGTGGRWELDRLTYDEAVRENLQFMDQAAIAVCRENDLPIIVFDMTVPGNIRKVVAGEAIGTKVSG